MNTSGMPAANTPEHLVTNNGFYPDLDLAEFVDNYAIATQYGSKVDMTVQKLALAIGSVNKDLTLYFATNWLGLNTLADVPGDEVNGESITVSLYKHAVFSLAKSYLLISTLGENHRDKASAKAIEATDNEPHWLRQSNEAIAQLVNSSKNLSVALL